MIDAQKLIVWQLLCTAVVLGQGTGNIGFRDANVRVRDALPSTQGVKDSAIRRPARKGGVKRISGIIYEMTRAILKAYLKNVFRDAVTYTEQGKRKTVSAMDVVYTAKRDAPSTASAASSMLLL